MSNVIVKDNETLDSALRRFKRNCAKAGIQQEIRKREHYEKPSVRRKKKSEAARKRCLLYTSLWGEILKQSADEEKINTQSANDEPLYACLLYTSQ